MRRYISHLFTWVISFLTLLAFSSCLNEHPKDQLDGGGSNGSASEIFDTTIAPLYDFMGGAIEGEGIRDIQRLDSLLSLSPDDEQLYSSWQYLYRAIGMCNKSLDMIDLQSVRLTDNQKAQFKAEVRAIRAMMYYAEAMERNDGDGRAEYNMVRAHAGLPARKSSLANILEGRQVVLAGETCHRQDLIRFGKFLKSSHLRRSVQSALSSSSIVFPIPQRSLAFNGKLVQNKGYEAME